MFACTSLFALHLCIEGGYEGAIAFTDTPIKIIHNTRTLALFKATSSVNLVSGFQFASNSYNKATGFSSILIRCPLLLQILQGACLQLARPNKNKDGRKTKEMPVG